MKTKKSKTVFFSALALLLTLNISSTFEISFGGREAKADFLMTEPLVDCWDDDQVWYLPGHVLTYCADCSWKYDWWGWEVPQQCDKSDLYIPEPWCPPNGC